MPFCTECGTENRTGARFCTSCGRVVDAPREPVVGAGKALPKLAAAPPPIAVDVASASRRGASVPDWLSGDWVPAVVGAVVLVGAGLLGGALLGALLTVVASGDVGLAVDGALVGSYLAFAAFGAAVRAGIDEGQAVHVAFAVEALPLGLLPLTVGASHLVLRRVRGRVSPDPARQLAVVVKVASLLALVLALLAVVLSTEGASLQAEVQPLQAFVLAFLLVAGVGIWQLHHDGVSLPGIGQLSPWTRAVLRAARDGALVLVGFAVAVGAVSFLAALVLADSGTDRLLLVIGLPLHLGNLAAVGGVVGIGGSVTFAVADVTELGGVSFSATTTGSMGLFRFGFPPDASTGAAPFGLLVVLLAATPALLAWRTGRRLVREQVDGLSRALAHAVSSGAGFLVAALTAGVLGRIGLFATTEGLARPATLLVVRPQLATVLGYATLWAVLGTAVGLVVWWQRPRQAEASAVETAPAKRSVPPASSPVRVEVGA
jgi:hypothetical protein